MICFSLFLSISLCLSLFSPLALYVRTHTHTIRYGKALHIQVRATYPIRCKLLDRYVVFCCASDTPMPREDIITPKSPLASFRTSPTKFELLLNEDEDQNDDLRRISQKHFSGGKKEEDGMILMNERWECAIRNITEEMMMKLVISKNRKRKRYCSSNSSINSRRRNQQDFEEENELN